MAHLPTFRFSSSTILHQSQLITDFETVIKTLHLEGLEYHQSVELASEVVLRDLTVCCDRVQISTHEDSSADNLQSILISNIRLQYHFHTVRGASLHTFTFSRFW
jgi:hypothetical protein